VRCPSCNAENGASARFCTSCGQALAESEAAAREVRVATQQPAIISQASLVIPRFQVKIERWNRVDRLIALSSLLLFTSLFIPWFGYSSPGVSASESGLDAHGYLYIALFASLGLLLYMIARVGWDRLPTNMPFANVPLLLVVTLLNLLLVLTAFLFKPGGAGIGWDVGALLALVSAVAAPCLLACLLYRPIELAIFDSVLRKLSRAAERRKGSFTALPLALLGLLPAAGLLVAAPQAFASGSMLLTSSAGLDDGGEVSFSSTVTSTASAASGLTTAKKATWSTLSVAEPGSPQQGVELGSVSCVSERFCIAVDVAGRSYRYTGNGWQSAVPIAAESSAPGVRSNATATSLPTSGPQQTRTLSVACASTTLCLATDSKGEVWSFNGSAWQLSATLDENVPIYGISCTRGARCVAVDSAGRAFEFSSGSWSPGVQVTSGGAPLYSVSCWGLSSCEAVGGNGSVYSLSHGEWSMRRLFGNGSTHAGGALGEFSSISCSGGDFCEAVFSVVSLRSEGYSSQVFRYENGSWSRVFQLVTTAPYVALNGISCPALGFCVVVGPIQDVYWGSYVNRNNAWSEDTLNRRNDPILSVACTSQRFCVAVGASFGNHAASYVYR